MLPKTTQPTVSAALCHKVINYPQKPLLGAAVPMIYPGLVIPFKVSSYKVWKDPGIITTCNLRYNMLGALIAGAKVAPSTIDSA